MTDQSSRGIAVVGASERNFWARAAIANIRGYNYPGPIWPVNPNYTELDGMKCYPNLTALPGPAEAVLIAVRTDRCASVVADAVACGIPHIVVISDGFAERGNRALQDELVAPLRGSRSNLYGPNCVGFIDIPSGLCAIGEPIPMDINPGPVSFISQSGALVSSFMSACVEEGVGLDWCVSLGNGAHVDVARAIAIAVDRATTRVVCLYAEGLGRDTNELAAALDRARSAGKWVLMLKTGLSDAASRIALSHTGSMVGPDHLASSYLEAHGAIRADGIEELVRLASICSIVQGRPTGGVAVVGSSGGAAGLTSDAAIRYGLHLARLSDETSAKLREVAPAGSFIDNPFDITGRPGAKTGVDDMWGWVFSDPNVAFVVAPHTVVYPDDSDNRAVHRNAMLLFQRLAATTGTPTISTTLATQSWTPWVEELRDGDHPNWVLGRGLDTTLRALAKIFPGGPSRDEHQPTAEKLNSRLLTEEEGRSLLISAGLPLVPGMTFVAPERADLAGLRPPVVVKVVAEGVSHKAKLGGVRLSCLSDDEVRQAAAGVVAAVSSAIGESAVRGVRVEQMVAGPELLIGLQRDPQLGAHLTIGIGGPLAEAAAAVRTVMLPLSVAEIRNELVSLRLGPVLRDSLEAVSDVIAQAAHEFTDGVLSDLTTVEINPLIVTPTGPCVADVLILR